LNGDDPEDDGAGKGSEIAEFAVPSEMGVGRLPPGEQIGEPRDPQRRGMAPCASRPGSSAIDPNSVPATISKTIMTAVSADDEPCARSLRACFGPRNKDRGSIFPGNVSASAWAPG